MMLIQFTLVLILMLLFPVFVAIICGTVLVLSNKYHNKKGRQG